MGVDLDSYFERIGYAGPRAPTLPVLAGIVRRHAETIPFENIDPLLGRTPELGIGEIEAKLVRSRRGGYCFEQNPLLAAVLEALGFPVRVLAARVLLHQPVGARPARTHALLDVGAGGARWLVDVGFGGASPAAPVRLEANRDTGTDHGLFRVEADGNERVLAIRASAGWKALYRFGDAPQEPSDLAMANHFVATWPASIFRGTVMAARVAPDGRHLLINERLAFEGRDGRTERRLTDADAVLASLDAVFGIAVPDPDGFREAFARVMSRPPLR